MIPQFIGAMLAAGVLVVGSSFLWPRLTGQDRPSLLEEVHTKALETELGQRAENILGDTDNKEPINVASVSSTVINTVGQTVQKKSEEIIQTRITEEFIRRIELLPTTEKEKVEQAICKPATASAGE
jgi:hypothetical protein